MTPKRFNSLQIVLHWLLAGLILISLTFGLFYLQPLTNDDNKITPLRIHMLIGILIGILIIFSVLVRLFTSQPDRLKSGHALVDGLALVVHAVLRIGVIGMVISGIVLSVRAGLFAIVFAHSGAALPDDFSQYLPYQVHALVARILMAVTALHIVGALFHQFVRKEKPFARMGVGARSIQQK